MGDGRGALPRLVREQPPVDSLGEGIGERSAQKAPRRRAAAEGVAEHRGEGREDGVGIGDDHRRGAEGIDDAHGGHDGRRHRGDAADAADDDKPEQDRQRSAAQPRWDAERGFEARRHVVALRHVAGAQGAEHGRHGEQHRHALGGPFPAFAEAGSETPLHVVHGTTGDLPAVVRDAVLVGDRHLDELGRHAEEGRHPHPEQRRRAAEVQRQRHPADVAGADGAGKCRRKRLQVAGVTGGVGTGFTAKEHAPGMAEEAHLRQAEIEREQEPHAQQHEGEPGRTAEDSVQRAENVAQCVQENGFRLIALPPAWSRTPRPQWGECPPWNRTASWWHRRRWRRQGPG